MKKEAGKFGVPCELACERLAELDSAPVRLGAQIVQSACEDTLCLRQHHSLLFLYLADHLVHQFPQRAVEARFRRINLAQLDGSAGTFQLRSGRSWLRASSPAARIAIVAAGMARAIGGSIVRHALKRYRGTTAAGAEPALSTGGTAEMRVTRSTDHRSRNASLTCADDRFRT